MNTASWRNMISCYLSPKINNGLASFISLNPSGSSGKDFQKMVVFLHM